MHGNLTFDVIVPSIDLSDYMILVTVHEWFCRWKHGFEKKMEVITGACHENYFHVLIRGGQGFN